MAALITEFLSTTAMGTHQRLVAEHPPGLAPLLRARGFGPSPACRRCITRHRASPTSTTWRTPGQDGRLARALGPRRADELLAQMPALRHPIRSLRLKSAWETAQQLVDLLANEADFQVAGAARRMCETVVGGLDLVAEPTRTDAASLLDLFERLPQVVNTIARSEGSIAVRLYDAVEVRVFLCEPSTRGAALV